MAKKSELGDLQRIISALENKIDIASFEALVRAVEMKPDRHELSHVLPSSYRGGAGASMIEKEMDRSMQHEFERRILEVEKQVQVVNRDISMQTE